VGRYGEAIFLARNLPASELASRQGQKTQAMPVVELTEDSLLETERFFYRGQPGLRMLTKAEYLCGFQKK